MENKKLYLIFMLVLPFIAFWKEGGLIFSSTYDLYPLIIPMLFAGLIVIILLKLVEIEVPSLLIGITGSAILIVSMLGFLTGNEDIYDVSNYFVYSPLTMITLFATPALSIAYAIKRDEI